MELALPRIPLALTRLFSRKPLGSEDLDVLLQREIPHFTMYGSRKDAGGSTHFVLVNYSHVDVDSAVAVVYVDEIQRRYNPKSMQAADVERIEDGLSQIKRYLGLGQ